MIFRSPYPDVSIPEVSVTDFVFQNAHKHGDKLALIDGVSDRSYTISVNLSQKSIMISPWNLRFFAFLARNLLDLAKI